LSFDSFFCRNGPLCVMSQNWRRYASASQSRTGLASWPLYPIAIPGCLWVVSTDLEKVAAAFPAVIGGKSRLQDHIFARLTHIIAHFRRSAVIFSGISIVFCARLTRRGDESIWDSGEVMRRKICRRLIHSSSLNWRGYESELANL